MSKVKFSGPLPLRLRSLATISRIFLTTAAQHGLGRKMAPDWDVSFETGIRFIRHQFTAALRGGDMARGRLLFDSLQLETDDVYAVTRTPNEGVAGQWITPNTRSGSGSATILYLHGGGYSFHGGVSDRFADMLAHHMQAPVLAPTYRLTPEHPHPAQAEDAMAAWDDLSARVPPEKIIVIGDSAGGHMALMLVQALHAAGKPQPALCIGLCPWTDIGARGDSLHGNDPFDLVQGWMALKFGEWLDPEGRFGRAALSPISHSFAGLAPLYLQAGGREVLRDMIVDFADVQARQGADVMLDVWADMPHDFQAYDRLKPSATQALTRMRAAIAARVDGGAVLEPLDGVTRRTAAGPPPNDQNGNGSIRSADRA